MGNIYFDADLGGIVAEMQAAEGSYPGPFFRAVVALIDDINNTHQPDTDGDCQADGCQSQYGDPEFNLDWPCPVWMRAHNVAVAWLRERAAEALTPEDPLRVAARERKARQRQREREAGSPVQANGNPSGQGAGNPSGDQVTTTSPEHLFLEKSQVDDSRPSGQARDSPRDTPGDNLSEPLPASTNLSETSARSR